MTDSHSNELNVADVLALLANGDLDVQGMLPWSSNYTLLTVVRCDGLQGLAVISRAVASVHCGISRAARSANARWQRMC